MILCCGEALIDMIPSQTLNGQNGYVPHSGGAVFNTAVALGRLGIDVGLLTGLSTDLSGKQLRQALARSHVDMRFAITTDRPTPLAFVELEDGQASYSFFDENSALRQLSIDEIPELDPGIDCLFFGGISLANGPCAETFASLLERDRGSRLTMIDPNIRPQFVEDVKRFRSRITGMIENCDIAKISDEDLAWLYPDEGPTPDRLAAILKSGPSRRCRPPVSQSMSPRCGPRWWILSARETRSMPDFWQALRRLARFRARGSRRLAMPN